MQCTPVCENTVNKRQKTRAESPEKARQGKACRRTNGQTGSRLRDTDVRSLPVQLADSAKQRSLQPAAHRGVQVCHRQAVAVELPVPLLLQALESA